MAFIFFAVQWRTFFWIRKSQSVNIFKETSRMYIFIDSCFWKFFLWHPQQYFKFSRAVTLLVVKKNLEKLRLFSSISSTSSTSNFMKSHFCLLHSCVNIEQVNLHLSKTVELNPRNSATFGIERISQTTLTLQCLVVTKMSHILKQTCSSTKH